MVIIHPMTQAARHSRLRALATQLDLGYTLPLILGVVAFVIAVFAYFELL